MVELVAMAVKIYHAFLTHRFERLQEEIKEADLVVLVLLPLLEILRGLPFDLIGLGPVVEEEQV
jgi:hypothetical protein